MDYIVIKKALKEKCPPGITGFWNFHQVPPELWELYEKVALPDRESPDRSAPPDFYFDKLDEMIENYSNNFPEYFWNGTIKEEEKTT